MKQENILTVSSYVTYVISINQLQLILPAISTSVTKTINHTTTNFLFFIILAGKSDRSILKGTCLFFYIALWWEKRVRVNSD